jgi:hypothetical protein
MMAVYPQRVSPKFYLHRVVVCFVGGTNACLTSLRRGEERRGEERRGEERED